MAPPGAEGLRLRYLTSRNGRTWPPAKGILSKSFLVVFFKKERNKVFFFEKKK
jgi:hypothetical protein